MGLIRMNNFNIMGVHRGSDFEQGGWGGGGWYPPPPPPPDTPMYTMDDPNIRNVQA